jgi:hypothetical protein
MKKNKKDANNPKKHGIISIVQSPDKGQNTSDDLNQSDTENTSRIPEKEHGIISIVQAPDLGNNTSENLSKSVTENKPDNTEEHGIISIVQAPHRETDKQLNA